MTGVQRAVVGIAMLAFSVVMGACSTIREAQVKTAEATAGDTIKLFYGGNNLAKDEFCLNAVVPVYRYVPPYERVEQKTEVGKIKVTGFEGDDFLVAIVLEGTIKSGDFAVQPHSECLILVPVRVPKLEEQ
jgi:hypothetical protein